MLTGSQSHSFTEERYIYSIDKHLQMRGTIRFDDAGMEIDYTAPMQRRVVYREGSMEIYGPDGKLEQRIDLDDEPMMKLYMRFIFLLYRGDLETLESYFTIRTEGKRVSLSPIPPADKVVRSVEVVREGKQVKKITTMMSNNDEITIDIAQ
jgi:hypothetical protein